MYGYEVAKRDWLLVVMVLIATVFVLLLLCGCSSTNLNGIRVSSMGIKVTGCPFDAQNPGKVDVIGGYSAVTIIPMARGQGAQITAMTYEILSGRPMFAEEIIVYPIGQDSVLKLERQPQSVLKIPWLLDIKAGPATETVLTVEPTEEDSQ